MARSDALFDLLALPGGASLILSAHPARDAAVQQALLDYRNAGAGLLVSLLEQRDLDELGLGALQAQCRQAGLEWAHCPIEDFGAPGAAFETPWSRVSAQLHERLDRGGAVALHCRAGLGRTGTVAARILLERGWPLAQAVAAVRQARPGAIETQVQERYLQQLQASRASAGEGAAT